MLQFPFCSGSPCTPERPRGKSDTMVLSIPPIEPPRSGLQIEDSEVTRFSITILIQIVNFQTSRV